MRDTVVVGLHAFVTVAGDNLVPDWNSGCTVL